MCIFFKKMAIQVTKRAAEELIKRSQHILFSCKGGGCNGFEYVLEPCAPDVSKVEKQTESNGVNVYTCNMSMLHLLGTTIDWSEDIMGSRFVFENPNAHSMCGCGATFST
tara:strand:+ start:463 stop:792 length:330 start_codon:yes stop_codon:yes gene_type:complete